jgi:hypothetical protein
MAPSYIYFYHGLDQKFHSHSVSLWPFRYLDHKHYAPQLMHSGGAFVSPESTVVFSPATAAASAAFASTVNLIASTAAFVRK